MLTPENINAYLLIQNNTQSLISLLIDLNHIFRNTLEAWNFLKEYRVKHFVCDMWKPYVDLAHVYFPNAEVIIDKYHFIRQVTWAIENVRKRLQKTMPAPLRKYYKRSHKLILSRYAKLKDDNKKACDLMLLYNDDLRLAHRLKEEFYYICKNTKYSEQIKDFFNWIKAAESSGIAKFEKCAFTYRNWSKEILNAFKYGLTNLTNRRI